jgi:4'-phosphopantetheinyl transferase
MMPCSQKEAAATIWRRPHGHYELATDEVHVWRANLNWPQERINRLVEVLSQDERARAQRYHFEADRRRSIIARGLSRLLLAHCLGESPRRLQFAYNPFGKPALAPGHARPLQFNVSHSGEWVLIALSLNRPLGIDVEREKEEMATEAIAGRFFSPAECSALAALPPALRCAAFFSCWARKEAYLKARGDGLSLPLDQFDVAFVPGVRPRLIATRHDPAEAQRWTLSELQVGCNYAAALAVEGADWTLKCWDWPAKGPALG